MSIFGKNKFSPRDMSPFESRGHVVRKIVVFKTDSETPSKIGSCWSSVKLGASSSLKFCARRPSLFGRGHRTVTIAIRQP